MFIAIIIFIITLLVLVVIHELGHFLVAKQFNIKVLEFGFGIPPRAWGKKFGETLVSVNWLPFGGFVRLLGEDEVDKSVLDDKRSFASQSVGKRISVVVAGVVMNLFLAWLLFYLVLGLSNFKADLPLLYNHEFVGANTQIQNSILIQRVQDNSPAKLAGLAPGMVIKAVNGQTFSSATDLTSQIKNLAGTSMELTVVDSSTQVESKIKIIPRVSPPEGEGALGVALAEFQVAKLSYDAPLQKIFSGPIHAYNLTVYSGGILGKLIGQSFIDKSFTPVSQTVSGPVGITSVVNSILTESKEPLIPYLNFVALLSLNLAVMNVLPFPALDGGRLLFLLIEAITRKRVKAEVEKWVHTIGMAILLTLMLLVTFSDIKKFF